MRIPVGFDLEKAELLLSSEESVCSKSLKPYEARVYKIDRPAEVLEIFKEKLNDK